MGSLGGSQGLGSLGGPHGVRSLCNVLIEEGGSGGVGGVGQTWGSHFPPHFPPISPHFPPLPPSFLPLSVLGAAGNGPFVPRERGGWEHRAGIWGHGGAVTPPDPPVNFRVPPSPFWCCWGWDWGHRAGIWGHRDRIGGHGAGIWGHQWVRGGRCHLLTPPVNLCVPPVICVPPIFCVPSVFASPPLLWVLSSHGG